MSGRTVLSGWDNRFSHTGVLRTQLPSNGRKPKSGGAFWQVAQQIRRRLELLALLPFEKLDALRLEAATQELGAREKIQIGTQAPA
jgi:hypothetical protein